MVLPLPLSSFSSPSPSSSSPPSSSSSSSSFLLGFLRLVAAFFFPERRHGSLSVEKCRENDQHTFFCLGGGSTGDQTLQKLLVISRNAIEALQIVSALDALGAYVKGATAEA